MVSWRRSLHVALALSAVILCFPALAQSPGPGCESWAARLISYQGTLIGRRASGMQLVSVSVNDTFCVGDVLEIGAYSRAAIQLPDQTVVRLDQGTIVTFVAPKDDKRTWLDILKGAIHVISRDPRALRVVTPFANAGIEGTEFLVRVDVDTTLVLVYEGSVKVANALGESTAGSGQSVLAEAGRAPVLQQVVRPRDQVVWTLYYPPTGAGADPLVARAEEKLGVGRVAEAEADLAEALKQAPGSSDVLARQSVIALTRNDPTTAMALADQAVATTPGSVPARLAQSYVRQSGGDLPGAIATLEAAATDHPADALVRARLAELYLATGDTKRGEASAKAAVAADPTLGLAHAVLGFVELSRVNLRAAKSAFEEAIRLDSNAPLPRLGLGLAKIRGGDLVAGREEIETAVILDPNNSIVRSYMGKAYYEEKRDKLAASQLAIAKELDPNDPTPWFYDAIRKQTVNRPVEALSDLRKSAELNNRRAVYRSQLLLDDDAAARNASISAIYNELGFESLAIVEATGALADNFGNSSAHRLLANAYGRLPRYDISRVSEAFQAQVRQPLSAPPVTLLESADDLTVLAGAGPSVLGSNEYNALFERDRLDIRLDAIAGSRGTLADQFVVTGLADRLGYAVSQLHYETDGFTDNNVGKKDVYSGFLHFAATPRTSLQFDVSRSEFLLGYTFFSFDPSNAFPIEIDERSDVLRANARHELSPAADIVWSVAYEGRTRDALSQPDDTVFTTTDATTGVGEVQTLLRSTQLDVVFGGGLIDKDEDFPIEAGQISTYDVNAYVYSHWRPGSSGLTLTGGFGFDRFRQDFSDFERPVTRSQISPKLGLVWPLGRNTTIRAAALTSVRRPFVGSKTLEPTQIAGFNQFFTGLEQIYGDPEGTVSRKIAAALDKRLSESLFAGFEASGRRLENPSPAFEADQIWREKAARGYLYKTFDGAAGSSFAAWRSAVSVALEYEDFNRPANFTGSDGILAVKTTRAPIQLALFGPGGISVRVGTTYIRQSGDFLIGPVFPVVEIDDRDWVTDASIRYRLPNRIGFVSLSAQNIGDSEVLVLEPDPLSPRTARRRIVTAGLSLHF